MKPIVGNAEARRIETIYTTPVAYMGEMYEFASWVVKNPLLSDHPAVLTFTELRSGKMKKEDMQRIIPLVNEKVTEKITNKN